MTLQTSSADRDFSFDLVLPSVLAATPKQAWKALAAQIAPMIGIKERILVERLAEQHKQMPSAMSDGCALCHMRIGSLRKSVTVFARFKNPFDFGAVDGKPVDLIAVVLSPEREGGAALRQVARLSRLLRNAQICGKLRTTSDEKHMRALLEHSSIQALAA